jgi:NAD(P)-dependent dehydrogenase (short-subunit alcohol dehydrogenase family)
MLECGAGSIVNVATVEAFRGIPTCAVYSAFKAGVVAFTRSLAVEVGGRGVRVNAIAPDVTETPQTPYGRWISEEEQELVPSWVPVGRFGTPEDAAAVALFLASDQARFVTGQTLPVDGGTLAASGWYKHVGKQRWTNRPRKP